jgi:transposase
MDKLAELARVSEPEQEALMAALWAAVPRLQAQLAARDGQAHEPRQDTHHSRVPPSQTPKAHLPSGPRTKPRREASVGRTGGGRPLHPDPDPVVMAQATIDPHGGGAVQTHEPHPQAVYDTIEWPSVQPLISRVEQHGGQRAHGGQPAVAPVPVGLEPGTPCGAAIEGLAPSLRSTHAISDARLSALVAPVYGVPLSKGALTHRCRRVNSRLDDRGAAILTRPRSSRLIERDATGAWVNGQTPGAWVFQPAEVWRPVIRPSRGHGVIHAILDAPRPTIGVSDLSRAQKHHPAEPWPVCGAHQWQDGPFAVEAGDTVGAPRLTAVLLRAFAIPQRRDTLAASTRSQSRGALQRRVDRCRASQPPTAPGTRLQQR